MVPSRLYSEVEASQTPDPTLSPLHRERTTGGYTADGLQAGGVWGGRGTRWRGSVHTLKTGLHF